MTSEEAIKILRREIECLSHTKCEDCILEAACDPIKTTPYDSEYIEVYEMAISALSKNKGEWKPEDERLSLAESLLFRCSKCNIIFGHQTNFCPNCGADMRGGKDEISH